MLVGGASAEAAWPRTQPPLPEVIPMNRWIRPLTWLLIVALAVAVCLLSGCRSAAAPGDASASLRASRELGEKLLRAFRDRDYGAFAALAPDSCRDQVPETAFRASTERLAKQFGKITGWRYLGEAETPGFRQLLWLVGFERPARAAAGKTDPVRRVLIFRMLTGATPDGVKIAGFGFL